MDISLLIWIKEQHLDPLSSSSLSIFQKVITISSHFSYNASYWRAAWVWYLKQLKPQMCVLIPYLHKKVALGEFANNFSAISKDSKEKNKLY